MRFVCKSLSFSLFCFAIIAVGLLTAFAQNAPKQDTHGINVSNMDRSVKPGDKFYNYCNGEWLKRTEIPPDRSRIGVFSTLADLSDKRTADLIEAASGSLAEPGQTRRYEADADFSDSYAYRRPRTPYGKSAAARAPHRVTGRQTSRDPLIGARVRHSKYGLGTIIEVEGEGEERKLTVSFQDYGSKKLIERYANLQLA